MIRVITIVVLGLAISSCSSNVDADKTSKTTLATGGEKDENGATRISVASTSITQNVNKEAFAKLMVEKPGTVLDVRTAKEFNQGNIEGSINYDVLQNTFAASVRNLDKSSPVYVYCKSGGRSARAMGELQKIGFKEIYNLNGGYDGWKK